MRAAGVERKKGEGHRGIIGLWRKLSAGYPLLLGSWVVLCPGGVTGIAAMITSLPLYAQGSAAQQAQSVFFDIAAGPLNQALVALGRQAGVQVSANAALTSRLHSAGLRGRFTVAEALDRLLAGSDLQAQALADGGFVVNRLSQSEEAGTLPSVDVLGRRTASPDELPPLYAGGQVARGARLGVMGNTSVMDAPFNVTAYTSELIENQQSSTLADVVRNDPSVRFSTSDGQNTDNFTIRGFELTSTDLAFNGIYGLLPTSHVPTEFVERVEVFKGPAAMLFGITPFGAVGGTINVVPKRAGDQPLTRLTVNYESDSRIGMAADVARRFGAEQQLGIRFNGAYADGRTGVEGQRKERQLAALGIDYVGERWKVELDAYTAVQNQDNGSSMHYGFSTLGRVISAPDARKNMLKGTYVDQSGEGFALRGEYQLNNAWNVYGTYGQAKFRYKGYVFGTRVVVLNDAGDSSGYTYHQRGNYDRTASEVGVRGDFATGNVGHKLVVSYSLLEWESGLADVGNSTSEAYVSNIYRPIRPPLGSNPTEAVKTADNSFHSLSLLDTLSFMDEKVLLTLGARRQKIDSRSWSAASGAMTSEYNQSVTTPVAGLVVKPWGEGISLYANYIQGLSMGQQVSAIYENEGETLAPFKTIQYETGVKWDAGRMTHTLSLFQITRPSAIDVDQGEGRRPLLKTDGRQRHRGVEWNVFGEVSNRVRVLGGVAYTQSEQKRTAVAVNKGNDAAGVPRWTVNLGAEWDVPTLAGITLDGRMIYTGPQYLDAANKLRLPSWTRFDVSARYQTRLYGKNTVFRFGVENLADRDYWSGRFGEGYATIGAPRTVKMSASIDF